MKYRIISVCVIIGAILLGSFIAYSEPQHEGKVPAWLSRYAFSLGLDLAGGTELTYVADTSAVTDGDADSNMSALRDVIERRVNLFGVSEPVVQVERGGAFGGGQYKLRVELPGITDVNEAIARIGETPTLEFRLVDLDKAAALASSSIATGVAQSPSSDSIAEAFIPTGLTGKYLERAQVVFNQQTGGMGQPIINLRFNSEGAELFAKITRENLGTPLAIFLDGEVISSPVIQEEITGGSAQISGQFTIEEAQQLVRNLNYGALPVPIRLENTQSVGAALGETAVRAGIYSGIIGLIALAVFLIAWYRLPGLISVLALIVYILVSLALFKFIPVTLTAAGIAGFILSIGMAVDANVLIFERMREERERGHGFHEAVNEGFARAWLSIRDSNISSIITAVILFWLGTSVVKGFALTLLVGVFISMLTAITISRSFLLAITPDRGGKLVSFLFGAGFTRSDSSKS